MHSMRGTTANHYIVMFFIMIVSGLLSTMNVWVNKLSDIRFSLNDGYMALLMTGWMFLFMGMIYREVVVGLIGLTLVVVNVWCIRTQFQITETQYRLGMIPHHSMAVHLSKKLLEKKEETTLKEFVQNIINTQEKEIAVLKSK